MVSNKALPSSSSIRTSLKGLLAVLAVLGGTIIVILSPFAVIWSLNTLFKLAIAYSFKTWLATYILMLGTLSTRVSRNGSKNS